MVKQGDKVKFNRVAEFYGAHRNFTGAFVLPVAGGVQIIRFTTWEGEDGTIYPTETVADASAVFPKSCLKKIIAHETATKIYYGYKPA